MSPSSLLALLALSAPFASAQASSVITFFLPDSEPLSLDASVISVVRATPTSPGGITPQPVTHLELACPTAPSPENDACRAASIYPAQVYHTQGSVWGGTTTYAGATTSWECALGSEPAREPEPFVLSAECKRRIISGSSKAAAAEEEVEEESFALDNCYVLAHRLPVVVTAGQEKIFAQHYMTVGADQVNSWERGDLSRANCPASTRSVWEKSAGAAGAEFVTTSTDGLAVSGIQTGTTGGSAESLETGRGVLGEMEGAAGRIGACRWEVLMGLVGLLVVDAVW